MMNRRPFPLLATMLLLMLLGGCVSAGPSTSPQSTSGETSVVDPTDASATNPAPPRLIVTHIDGSVTLVDEGGEVVASVAEPSSGTGPVQATASVDGNIAISRGPEGVVIWNDGSITRRSTPFVTFFFSWSPDGSRLAVLGNEDGGVGGRVLRSDSDQLLDLGVAAPHFLAWSPDAQRLGIHRNNSEIILIEADESRPLAATPGLFQAPAWLDSQTLLFVTEVSELEASRTPVLPAGRLTAWPLDGSARRHLLDVTGPIVFAPSPTGDSVAVAGEGVTIVDAHDGSRTDVTVDAGEQPVYLQWSPDGRRLLIGTLTSHATIRPAVWEDGALERFDPYEPTPTFTSEYLPFWGQYVRHEQPWAPSGDAFAYAAATADGRGQVFVQRLQSDAPTPITDGVVVAWMP